MSCRRNIASFGLAFLLGAVWCERAAADPIVTYIEQTSGEGSLGGIGFGGALVTISMTADAADLFAPSPGVIAVAGQATVSVKGIGEASFVDVLDVFSFAGPAGPVLGFADPNVFLDVLDTELPTGLAYDLVTPLAAVTGHPLVSPSEFFSTSAGGFNLALAGPTTFSASVQDVPEPASLVLFGSAASLLIAFGNGRRAITAP